MDNLAFEFGLPEMTRRRIEVAGALPLSPSPFSLSFSHRQLRVSRPHHLNKDHEQQLWWSAHFPGLYAYRPDLPTAEPWQRSPIYYAKGLVSNSILQRETEREREGAIE